MKLPFKTPSSYLLKKTHCFIMINYEANVCWVCLLNVLIDVLNCCLRLFYRLNFAVIFIDSWRETKNLSLCWMNWHSGRLIINNSWTSMEDGRVCGYLPASAHSPSSGMDPFTHNCLYCLTSISAYTSWLMSAMFNNHRPYHMCTQTYGTSSKIHQPQSLYGKDWILVFS